MKRPNIFTWAGIKGEGTKDLYMQAQEVKGIMFTWTLYNNLSKSGLEMCKTQRLSFKIK